MSKKPINIQNEIEKILKKEFELMLEENSSNPLFRLIRKGDLDPAKDIDLEKIRKKVTG